MSSAHDNRPRSALSTHSGPSGRALDVQYTTVARVASESALPDGAARGERVSNAGPIMSTSATTVRDRSKDGRTARAHPTAGITINTDRDLAQIERREQVRELAEWALGVISSHSSSSRYASAHEAIVQMRRGLTSGASSSSSSSKVEAFEALCTELEHLRTSNNASEQAQSLLALVPTSSSSSASGPRPASRAHHRSEHKSSPTESAIVPAQIAPRLPRAERAGPSRMDPVSKNIKTTSSAGSESVAGGTNVSESGKSAMPPASLEPGEGSEEEKYDFRGQTKAAVLAGWRKRKGNAPTETRLLLRDMLYLLQGIDGHHIRFARKSQSQKNAEANPYLVEPDFDEIGLDYLSSRAKGKEKDREFGAGDLHGRGVVVQEWMKEEDITGVDFIAEDGKLCSVSPSMQHTIMDLAESGMLYRSVYNFVQRKQAEAGPSGVKASMIEQSLCHFLEHELSVYHALLAELELQIGSDTSQLPPTEFSAAQSITSAFGLPGTVFENDIPAQDSEMTFQRLKLWSEEALLKLRVMSTLVDAAQHFRGGQLIATIHDLASHGDPFIREMIKRVLAEVSKPFFHSLQAWIFSGELADPFNEFFVQLNPEAAKKLGTSYGHRGAFDDAGAEGIAYMIWDKKYRFVKEMLPGFVPEAFGRKIFSTGKSINFIRHSCHDTEWTSIQAQFAQDGQMMTLEHSDIATLERTIDNAYRVASKRLLDIFFDDYKLITHLFAIKNYILLCAGDFADTLLQFVGPRLNKEASKLLRHHLTGDLENAIQGSLARNEPDDIARRIDANVEQPEPGDLGWDAFALKYSVDAPINAVLDVKATEDYDRLFAYLWSVRRTSHGLGSHWLQNTFAFRRLRTSKGLSHIWHRSHVLQSQMVHFMAELKAYCQLEGIELAWEKLMQYTQTREGDLDDLIAAHRAYLQSMKNHVLMLRGKETEPDSDALMIIAQQIMALIMGFQELMESLHRLSTNDALQKDREKDTRRGLTSAAATAYNPEKAKDDLARLEKQIKKCGDNFRHKMVEFVTGLESHPSNQVKFLAVRISFNEHYKATRKIKSKASSKSLRGQTQGTITVNLTTIAS